jgi:hypothetical protein
MARPDGGIAPNLNDLTKEALAVAVSKGWLPQGGESVCLTDAGRKAASKSQQGGKC